MPAADGALVNRAGDVGVAGGADAAEMVGRGRGVERSREVEEVADAGDGG
jgi:hypothetical protein